MAVHKVRTIIMTAPQISTQPCCSHQRLSIGLDSAYCPDCRESFQPWSREYKSVLEQPSCAVVKSAPEQSAPEQKHWVETYSPSKRKDYSYYRYVWMDGRRLRHIHIPGGNIHSAIVLYRKTEVEKAIALSMWASEIEDLIKSWR